MLLVCGAHLLGQRPGLQIGDVGRGVVARFLVADSLGQQPTDAEANDRIGQEVFF